MTVVSILQKILLLFLFFILGSIAPWWLFIPCIIFGIFSKNIGSEILIVTVILDVALGGGILALWYSYIVLGIYIFYQFLQRILFK